MGNVDEARTLNKAAEDLLDPTSSWEQRIALLAARYSCALAAERPEEALAHLQQLKHLDDSLYQDRVALKMAGLQVLYQLASKEKDNAALRDINAQQSNVLETVIQRSRIVALLAIIMFVLVVSLYLISRYAIKTLRRSKLKNEVIRKQHDEIQAKNLELQRQNLRLAESLIGEEEKEIVIKEIHHRVKNNLQVVHSLLSLQSGQQDDPQVTRLFKEAQGRIRSMALVHEHIYRTAGQHVGPLKEYLEQLTRNVLVAYGAHDRVSVTVQTQEVVFPMGTLMPLSLVVNELMTNAVKYAFREQDCGHISIVVRPSGNGHELLFNDDGGGMGHDPILPERSFGLELIRMLAQQLNGEVHILKGTGTTVSMSFASDALPMRVAS
jgi:two-component sensor histidine kinase